MSELPLFFWCTWSSWGLSTVSRWMFVHISAVTEICEQMSSHPCVRMHVVITSYWDFPFTQASEGSPTLLMFNRSIVAIVLGFRVSLGNPDEPAIHSVAQECLKFTVLWLQPPYFWDFTCMESSSALKSLFNPCISLICSHRLCKIKE